MQILDTEFLHAAPKRRFRRFVIVGKTPLLDARPFTLLFEQSPRIEACEADQWYNLIVALFLAGILAVPHQDSLVAAVDIAPGDAMDLGAAHRGCDRKASDAAHRDQHPRCRVQVPKNALQLIVGWTAIAFFTLG